MTNSFEAQSSTNTFKWFDELPASPSMRMPQAMAGTPVVGALVRQSVPPSATVTLRSRSSGRARVPVWSLVVAAIAGASVFILGLALISLT